MVAARLISISRYLDVETLTAGALSPHPSLRATRAERLEAERGSLRVPGQRPLREVRGTGAPGHRGRHSRGGARRGRAARRGRRGEGPGQDGRPRQGPVASRSRRPPTRPKRRLATSWASTSRATSSSASWSPRRTDRAGVLLLRAPRPRQPLLPVAHERRGRHGDRAARRREARGARPHRGRPGHRHHPDKAREIAVAANFGRGSSTRSPTCS